MIVGLDDLPPPAVARREGRSLPDVWTGERQRGVQLHLLAEAVTTWSERYLQRAWVRQLEGAIERRHEELTVLRAAGKTASPCGIRSSRPTRSSVRNR